LNARNKDKHNEETRNTGIRKERNGLRKERNKNGENQKGN
jgi:hypothetical protein